MKLTLTGFTSIVSRLTTELLCMEKTQVTPIDLQTYIQTCLSAGPTMLISIEAALFKHNVKITDFLQEMKDVKGYVRDEKYWSLLKLAEERENEQRLAREAKQKFSVNVRNRCYSLQYRTA